MNQKKQTVPQGGQPEAWGLIIKVVGGSRTARERLAADIRTRNASMADPLFESLLFRRLEGAGELHIVTAARPRRDLIDRLMRGHRNVEATAILMLEGSGERHEAEYADGARTGDWRTFLMCETEVIVLAAGDAKDVAAFRTGTKEPEGADLDDELMFSALRSCEYRRDIGDTFMRIHWRLPSLEGIVEMGAVVARSFPNLRLEFFALPGHPRIASAQAVFDRGEAVLPWFHVDDPDETIDTINKRWAKLTGGEGQDMVRTDKGARS